jgi:hypothetical protein
MRRPPPPGKLSSSAGSGLHRRGRPPGGPEGAAGQSRARGFLGPPGAGRASRNCPTRKKVYAAYHDQGFEVIGIALENAQLSPGDTPDQSAAKLAKAKKVLTDFIAKEELPWPNFFDGLHFKTDLVDRYGITMIPTAFLLDQEARSSPRMPGQRAGIRGEAAA